MALKTPDYRVLFVCLGNICRSPTAEGVFRTLLADSALRERVGIDSAGTGAYHEGSPPDKRSQAAALKRGYDLSLQRARQVRDEDFEQFDYILAMDNSNLHDLQRRCPPALHRKLGLFLRYAPELGMTTVPDPYNGGKAGFEQVLDLIEAASKGLIQHLEAQASEA